MLGSPSFIILNHLQNVRQITNAVTNELNVKFLASLLITVCRDFIVPRVFSQFLKGNMSVFLELVVDELIGHVVTARLISTLNIEGASNRWTWLNHSVLQCVIYCGAMINCDAVEYQNR